METWEMIEPNPGDHIRVKLKGYYHHGIYIGNDEVIQFGHPFDVFSNHDEIAVIKSNIEDFLHGGFLEVRIYNKKELKKKRPADQIIKTANELIGTKGYHILYNNCEHFANYCVFLEKISHQIDDVHDQIKEMLGKK